MRRLVIACDGTWNTADQWPTNVVKLSRAVRPVDEHGITQMVFYDPGVGTGNALDRITGGAFGEGISTRGPRPLVLRPLSPETHHESRIPWTARPAGGRVSARHNLAAAVRPPRQRQSESRARSARQN